MTFRWCRFAAWGILLLALGAGLWLNRVGLPDFLKTRLVAALRADGVQLEFSRMRLSLARGLVADNVRVGGLRDGTNSILAAREVQLNLDYGALFHRRFNLNGLTMHDGIFSLAASPTNSLTLTNIQTQLRFGTNDTWTLDHFRADFLNVRILLSGELAHADEIRDWKIFSSPKTIPPGVTNENRLVNRDVLDRWLQQFSGPYPPIYFKGEPVLEINVGGDARDVHSIVLRLDANVPGIRSPWFSANDLRLAAQITAPNDAPVKPDPAWGFWTNLQPFQLEWNVRAADFKVEKMEADTLFAGGGWSAPKLSIKKITAKIANGNLDAGAELDVATRLLTFTNNSNFDPHQLAEWLTKDARARLADILWTQPPTLLVGGSLELPAWTNYDAGWREKIAPTVKLDGQLAFTNAVVNGTRLDFVQTHFDYARRFWNLSAFELAQGRTHLDFDGDADETTAHFNGHLRGELEAASARPFLTASNLTQNFDRFKFNQPLVLDVSVQGSWRDWNSLGISGSAALTNFSVAVFSTNECAVDFLRADFNYTNQFWNLSGLKCAQGRTQLEFSGTTSDSTENFVGHLRGDFDPASLRPLLSTPEAARGFEHLDFHEPLRFNLDAVGNWRQLASVTATGRVALTNFSIRAQAIESVAGDLFYTNRTLEFFHPLLYRANGKQMMTADQVTLDFQTERIYFTNGFSTAEPMFVVRCIGPKTAKLIEPYQFPGPPTASVNGCSPMRDVKGGHDLDDADLTFVILKPTPFQWEKLRSPAMTGTIRWLGQKLVLTNIVADVYGGNGSGNAYFDFTPQHPGADFQFALFVTNVDLHLLVQDLSSMSNKLEGALSGKLIVTNASSETWRSWNGFGDAKLQNGQLWNVPVFGVVSAGINLFLPGMGNSRATDAGMQFNLTNGVIYSDSLEMHTATMRLQYAGTVDLKQNVDARVTAQLLRNTPVVGTLFSTILSPVSKIFECRVTGQLSDPKITPLYIPFSKALLAPLHPIQSFEEMFMPSEPEK